MPRVSYRAFFNLFLAFLLALPLPIYAATDDGSIRLQLNTNSKIGSIEMSVTHQLIPIQLGENQSVSSDLELTSWFFYPETEEQVTELVRRIQTMMVQLDQDSTPFTVLTVTDKADVKTTDDVPGSLTRGLSEKLKQLNRLVHATKEYKDKVANKLKSIVSRTVNASLSLVPDEHKIGLKMWADDLAATSEKIANGSLYKSRLPVFSITRGVVNGSWAVYHFTTGYAAVGIPLFLMIDTGLSPHFSQFPIMSMATAVGVAMGVASASMTYKRKTFIPWISTPGPLSNAIGNYMLDMSYDFFTEDIPGTNNYESLPGQLRLMIDRKLYEAFRYEAQNNRVRNIALNASLVGVESSFYGLPPAFMALASYAMATAPGGSPIETVAMSLAAGLLGQMYSDKAAAKFDTLNRLKHAAAIYNGLGEEDLRRFKHTEVWASVLQTASSIAPTTATIATLGGDPLPGRIVLGSLFVTGLIADRIAGDTITRFILANANVPDCIRFLKGQKPITEPPEK